MNQIQIKNRYTGSVIFEHATEKNTVKVTILQAIEVSADLSRADLSRADLSRADLSDADLSDADLSRADLSRADLSDANLSGADLRDADLRPIKHDLFGVLLYAQHEVPAMLEALKNGNVDGSTYSGDCACLVGTICKIRKVDAELPAAVLHLPKDSSSAIERWFMGIRPGDTPESSLLVKITTEWVEEFLSLTSPAVVA